MIEKIEESDQIINCRVTGTHIFTLSADDRYVSKHSHGRCVDCNDWFSIEALSTPDGMGRASWPVRYIGYYCQECAKKPVEFDEPLL